MVSTSLKHFAKLFTYSISHLVIIVVGIKFHIKGHNGGRQYLYTLREDQALEKPFDVFADPQFKSDAVNKVALIKTDDLGADVYYFQPGQVLEYHKHKTDQIFFILKGEGTFSLDDGTNEQTFAVKAGAIVLAPNEVWHKLENTGNDELIAAQATKLPTDLHQR